MKPIISTYPNWAQVALNQTLSNKGNTTGNAGRMEQRDTLGKQLTEQLTEQIRSDVECMQFYDKHCSSDRREAPGEVDIEFGNKRLAGSFPIQIRTESSNGPRVQFQGTHRFTSYQKSDQHETAWVANRQDDILTVASVKKDPLGKVTSTYAEIHPFQQGYLTVDDLSHSLEP